MASSFTQGMTLGRQAFNDAEAAAARAQELKMRQETHLQAMEEGGLRLGALRREADYLDPNTFNQYVIDRTGAPTTEFNPADAGGAVPAEVTRGLSQERSQVVGALPAGRLMEMRQSFAAERGKAQDAANWANLVEATHKQAIGKINEASGRLTADLDSAAAKYGFGSPEYQDVLTQGMQKIYKLHPDGYDVALQKSPGGFMPYAVKDGKIAPIVGTNGQPVQLTNHEDVLRGIGMFTKSIEGADARRVYEAELLKQNREVEAEKRAAALHGPQLRAANVAANVAEKTEPELIKKAGLENTVLGSHGRYYDLAGQAAMIKALAEKSHLSASASMYNKPMIQMLEDAKTGEPVPFDMRKVQVGEDGRVKLPEGLRLPRKPSTANVDQGIMFVDNVPVARVDPNTGDPMPFGPDLFAGKAGQAREAELQAKGVYRSMGKDAKGMYRWGYFSADDPEKVYGTPEEALAGRAKAMKTPSRLPPPTVPPPAHSRSGLILPSSGFASPAP